MSSRPMKYRHRYLEGWRSISSIYLVYSEFYYVTFLRPKIVCAGLETFIEFSSVTLVGQIFKLHRPTYFGLSLSLSSSAHASTFPLSILPSICKGQSRCCEWSSQLYLFCNTAIYIVSAFQKPIVSLRLHVRAWNPAPEFPYNDVLTSAFRKQKCRSSKNPFGSPLWWQFFDFESSLHFFAYYIFVCQQTNIIRSEASIFRLLCAEDIFFAYPGVKVSKHNFDIGARAGLMRTLQMHIQIILGSW